MKNHGITLAIDCLGGLCACALTRWEIFSTSSAIDFEILNVQAEPMERGQAERIIPMIETCLIEAKCQTQQIDCIGVNIGPGSYTGIRVALSAARGISLAINIPLVGIDAMNLLNPTMDKNLISLATGRGDYVLSYGDKEWELSNLENLRKIIQKWQITFPLNLIGEGSDKIQEKLESLGYFPSQILTIDPIEKIAQLAKLASEKYIEHRQQAIELPHVAPIYMAEALTFLA